MELGQARATSPWAPESVRIRWRGWEASSQDGLTALLSLGFFLGCCVRGSRHPACFSNGPAAAAALTLLSPVAHSHLGRGDSRSRTWPGASASSRSPTLRPRPDSAPEAHDCTGLRRGTNH